MKKHLQSVFIVILVVLWTTFSSNLSIAGDSQSSYSEALKEFEKYVSEQMTLDKAPGLSVGFMKGDFTWTKGFGYSDLENKVQAKPESSYRLASITKTLTAISVLQLVEAGKIDLDAEVQTYVPYFPKKKWPVTVRLLLGHLGGISHYKNYSVEGRIKVHKSTKEALAIFQDFDLVAEPGTRYNYSSYGYNLLGAVIEGASGQSFGDYINKHIFGLLKSMAIYAESEDMIQLGAYVKGSNPELDKAIALHPRIERFLIQAIEERSPFKEMMEKLKKLQES